MEKKITIERIAIIIGTILGVVSFFWQVYESINQQKEQVNAEMTFRIPKEDLPIDLTITIINFGQRPVYIKKIAIQSVNVNFDDKLAYELIEYTKTQSEPIQPGQSREFKTQISYQELMDWFASTNQINLIVESPTQKIYEKDIKECVEDANRWANRVKEENQGSTWVVEFSVCTP
ncbi:MAG: hypothetical protein JNJ43_17235 [Anaerolineales bacterium]|nr:hypothetical protein [Anaerolineales bacterium]